jgi:HlyD family secretion protein
VISSPIMDVGGGTLLLKMADLSSVQVRTLVDETDIGKITPGLPAVVKVTAFPNQPFTGQVLKVEPQASADQTVTTFAVRIVLGNENGLLKPGMNADVAILITERKDVLAIPTNALRTTAIWRPPRPSWASAKTSRVRSCARMHCRTQRTVAPAAPATISSATATGCSCNATASRWLSR